MTFTSEAPRAWTAPSPAHPAPTGAVSAAGSLALTLHHTGSTTVLTMVGVFDSAGLRAVEGLVDRLGCTVTDHLVVEAADLHRVDEAGVRMLVALDCYMRARGGRLTVLDAGGHVARACTAAGLAVRSSARPDLAPGARPCRADAAGPGQALGGGPGRVPAIHADFTPG